MPFVRFVCGCQVVVWLPLLNLNLDFLVRSSDRNDRLVSSGFWSKMCDVSVKRLTMVGLLVCLWESFDRLVGEYWCCLSDVYLTSVFIKVSLISISYHQSEFDFSLLLWFATYYMWVCNSNKWPLLRWVQFYVLCLGYNLLRCQYESWVCSNKLPL